MKWLSASILQLCKYLETTFIVKLSILLSNQNERWRSHYTIWTTADGYIIESAALEQIKTHKFGQTSKEYCELELKKKKQQSCQDIK